MLIGVKLEDSILKKPCGMGVLIMDRSQAARATPFPHVRRAHGKKSPTISYSPPPERVLCDGFSIPPYNVWMKRGRVVAFLFALSSLSARAQWSQEAKLTASDGMAGDLLGRAVGISGNEAICAAPVATVGTNVGQGAAYVFRYNGSVWSQEQKLTASDGAANDVFGSWAAIDGNVAVLGAFGASIGGNAGQGAAYIFRYNGSNWVQEAKLTASDGAAGDSMGYCVAVNGNAAVIGARGANSFTGSAYVFRYNGSAWVQEGELTASDGASGDSFGYYVGLSGNVAVVSAPYTTIGPNTYVGSVYVFRYNGSSWVQEAKLGASDGNGNDQFGIASGVSGNAVIAGARYHAVGTNTDAGSAYIFRYNGSVWSQEAELTAPDNAPSDYFGYSVSISGTVAAVGALGDDVGLNADSGSAYIFRFDGSSWSEEDKLTASDGAGGDNMGRSISTDGDATVVGTYRADIGGNADQGAAYVFRGPTINAVKCWDAYE